MAELTSVNKEQRDSPRSTTLLMHKMHINLLKPINHNFGLELREFVQFCLMLSPVEFVLPMAYKPLNIWAKMKS